MKNSKFNKLNFSKIIDIAVKSVLVSLLLTIVVGYFTGFSALIVKGWSSEPTIPYESLVIEYKNTKLSDLKVGDYITWTNTGKSYTTHRVIAIKYNGYFQDDEEITFTINGETKTEKFSQLKSKATSVLASTNCNIITQQKGGVDKPCDLINYQKNFAGKVINILPVTGKVVEYVKNNFQQLVFSVTILYVAYWILKIEPKYIRLF